jgi:hypothetical protein
MSGPLDKSHGRSPPGGHRGALAYQKQVTHPTYEVSRAIAATGMDLAFGLWNHR